MSARSRREFGDLNEANRISNVHAQKLSSIFFPAIEFLGVVATVIVLFAGAKLIDGGSLEIGTLIAAVGMLQLVFQPLQELSELYGQVQAASAAMTKISTVLDAEHDITDREGAPEIGRIEGHLQLDERRLRLRRRARHPRHLDRRARRAAASRSSASRAAASRRPRS